MLRRSNPFPAWLGRQRTARAPTRPVLPEWIRPQRTKFVDAATDGPEWLHEIKFGEAPI
jgi:hypothetical protein